MSADQIYAEQVRAAEALRSRTLLTLIEHTLTLQVRSVIIWGVALGMLGMMYVALYPSFADQQDLFDDMIESLPQSMRDLTGFGETSSFGSIEGFLSTEMFSLLVPLALAFFPILASASAIAGAEERGTIDVMLGNPLPRWQLVTSHFVATAISLLGILTITGLFMWVAALMANVDLSAGDTVNGVLNLWPLCIWFGALAMLCSAAFRRRVAAVAIPGAILVVMYVVNGLGRSVDWIDGLRPFSAFYYYGSAIQNGIDWLHFTVLVGAALVLLGMAIVTFQRRDIYT